MKKEIGKRNTTVVDMLNGKIYITKAFYKKSVNPMNPECAELARLMREHKGFSIELKETNKKTYANLTYEKMEEYIAENNINFYIIDGVKIGKEIGLGNRINTVLQSAFFSLTKLIPEEEVMKLMKDAATRSYSKKGDDIVKMNHDAIDAGATAYVKVEVPESWKNCEDTVLGSEIGNQGTQDAIDFVRDIQSKVNGQMGNTIPVSVTKKYEIGQTPSGTSAFEKRGIAVDVPVWDATKCIQCNRCSLVCPHAVIRPVVMTEEEKANAPADMEIRPMMGMPGMYFAITVSAADCTGCGSCAQNCPGMRGNKALAMKATADYVAEELAKKQAAFDYGKSLPVKTEAVDKFRKNRKMPVRVALPEEMLMIPMDATLIEQVLVNLLENAAKYAAADTALEAYALLPSDVSLCRQALALALRAGKHDAIVTAYEIAPAKVQADGRVAMTYAFALLRTGKVAEAETILWRDGGLSVTDIREGEVSLTSLYMEIEKAKAAAEGITLEDADIEVPRRFDFRMFVPKKK